MLISNHPDDERLSALAAQDEDAASDSALTAHVTSCARCATFVAELGMLRTTLAELPDLRPSRPLQFVPPVEDTAPASDGLGGWARRFFAPVLATGFALVMAGTVGTALPALGGAQSAASPVSEGAPAAQEYTTDASAGRDLNVASQRAVLGASSGEEDGITAAESATAEDEASGSDTTGDLERTTLTADRSPWPMVLFVGVALIVAAGLMRWILIPRAG